MENVIKVCFYEKDKSVNRFSEIIIDLHMKGFLLTSFYQI